MTSRPSVVTTGAAVFTDALRRQGVRPVAVDWRPPLPGTASALRRLAAGGSAGLANDEAFARMVGARPHLVGVVPARQAFTELDERTFLHAGPPVRWDDAAGPLRGAVVGGLLYEGVASTPEEAVALAARGDVRLEPCHDHRAVGPMAGVVTPSMPVFVVEDEQTGARAFSTLNEGLGKVLRYGAFGPDVLDRLRWMERVLGPVLADSLARHGPVDVMSLIAQALQMGDDGHNRNRAGSCLFVRETAASLVRCERHPAARLAEVLAFAAANDHFVLNLVMAAAKVCADRAAGVDGSSLVVAMARNGTEFGLRLAGTGASWFTCPASRIDGVYLGTFGPADASLDIGDSTITETVGLGGFAMAASPAIGQIVGGTSEEAVGHTLAMYEITHGEHPVFRVPALDFRGTPTGIDAVLVARTGVAPVVNTGIAGREPGVGQIGAGIVRPALDCFAAAVRALAERVPRDSGA